jgi:Zn-dependent protease with chaperone function
VEWSIGMKKRKVSLSEVFEYVELQSEYLQRLLQEVVDQIGLHVDFDEEGFGPLYEKPTISGENCEVTEDGIIYINSNRLKRHTDEVASAVIAHELAHYHLEHYGDERCQETLECEEEADQQAREWGFNVDEFRRVLGPATLPVS